MTEPSAIDNELARRIGKRNADELAPLVLSLLRESDYLSPDSPFFKAAEQFVPKLKTYLPSDICKLMIPFCEGLQYGADQFAATLPRHYTFADTMTSRKDGTNVINKAVHYSFDDDLLVINPHFLGTMLDAISARKMIDYKLEPNPGKINLTGEELMALIGARAAFECQLVRRLHSLMQQDEKDRPEIFREHLKDFFDRLPETLKGLRIAEGQARN